MPTLKVSDVQDWRRFFRTTGASVGVDTALPWMAMGGDVPRRLQAFVEAILFGLASLGASITPRFAAAGQDFVPRELGNDVFLFSHHTIGSGERILRFKHSYRPGYFSLDRLGYAGFSELARRPELLEPAWSLPAPEALNYLETLRTHSLETNASKFAQPPISDDGPEPGYILIAMQIPDDTVMRLAEFDPLAFYERVISEAEAAGRRCVVKRHPLCTNERAAAFITALSDRPLVTVSTLSVNQLLPSAERVIVINSTVGMEALIHGRPTFTAAPCEYAPLTTVVGMDDIARAVRGEALFHPVQTARFVQFYFERYCVRLGRGDFLQRLQVELSTVPPLFGWAVENDLA